MVVSDRIRRIGMYTGGFIGPFGGGMVIVLVPEFRDAFGISAALAALTITAYMIPYALLQLVSGTLGERYGQDRLLGGAFLVYAAGALACAAVSSIVPFLIARVIQGSANAFTSPLALARLAAATPEESMGKAMGTWNSVQTSAIVMAPVLGGLAGAYDYRLAFVMAAAVSLLLAVIVPAPGAERKRNPDPPRLRSALTPKVGWLGVSIFMFVMCTLGLAVIVSLKAADEFGVGAGGRGLLIAGFGLAGVIAGRPAGLLVDRVGVRAVSLASIALAAAGVLMIAFASSTAALAAFWLLAGLAASATFTTLNTLIIGASTENRGGAISIIGSFRFAGAALSSIAWVAVYHADERLAFVSAAAGCALTSLTVLKAMNARATGRAAMPGA